MNKEVEKIVDNLIFRGFKVKKSDVTTLYGVYFIELHFNAYTKNDLKLILSALPEDALVGHYPNLTSSLAINTRISIRTT